MPIKANVVLAAGVGVIAAVAVLAAVIAVQREPQALDPGSPEATVQAYLAAISAGGYGDAIEQLADDTECGISDLTAGYLPESLEVVLKHTSIDGPEALVTVEITELYGEGPFDGSGYAHRETLLLRDEGGHWRITGSPWPMYDCAADYR
jgi:hypothetical protein